MLYLIYGTEEYLINKETNDISNDFEENSINRYNLENTLIDEVIDDANTYSLFGRKLIIVENSYIFTGENKKNELNHNINLLESYILNPSESTILVFVVLSEKLDNRKKIVKLFNEKGTVKELNKIDNINAFVKSLFKGYKISDKCLSIFLDRVGNNLKLLDNEAEKLKLYKYGDAVIKEEDILACTTKNFDLDIFKFIDDIILKKKNNSLMIYQELIKNGEEPIKIIIMLANQIRIMYQSKILLTKGYSESNIAKILDIHPYRVKLAIQKGYSYSNDVLLEYLLKLSDLDLEIKWGKVNAKDALELFILEL